MPKATYMYWQKRFDRENPDKELEERILEIRKSHKDYGYRRILGELRNQNIVVNKKKVQRIMQKLGLQVTSFTRKSRKYSSYKGKVGTIAPNRIRRRFNTHIPRQKITTDTTEFKYYEVDSKGHMTMHKLYLDPFMDMCNGEILSFGIDKHPSAENVLVALEKAIKITSDCPYRRTFHSDQGWAYQMKAYSRRLKEERIFQSMSRKGNCHDNSVMENFFGLLKQEIYYGVVYYSFEELKSEIERYIKYYNEQRIKEKLGWIILMLLYNGTRISEFLDLKKENVHLEEQYFDVIDSKTENGIRKVPIADKLLPYYKGWYESCPDCEYLLHTEDGKRFLYRNYYDSYWTPLVEQIGIDRTPHCTRHTCISMLSEAGVQDTTIKKIVGHSGAMTLTEKVYTHLDMRVLVDAINKTLENKDSVTADTKSA